MRERAENENNPKQQNNKRRRIKSKMKCREEVCERKRNKTNVRFQERERKNNSEEKES